MIDDFYQLIEEALTKSPLKPLRNAIKNALKLKKQVYQMFRHGELPLHNNHNEQLIRPTTSSHHAGQKEQSVCEVHGWGQSQCDLV